MHILLTGGTGYLGNNILQRLSNNKNNFVFVLTRNKYKYNEKNNVSYIDANELEAVFKKGLDLVIHSATQYDHDPDSFYNVFETNMLLPLNLLKLCIANNTLNFINIDSFYSKNNNPHSKKLPFYKLSKNNFVDWGSLISNKFNLNFYNIKLFHLYGFEKSSRKLINYLIHGMNKNETIKLSSGNDLINFIFIDDAVNIIELFINKLTLSESNNFFDFHLGDVMQHSVKDLVCMLQKITNTKSRILFGVIEDNDDFFEPFDLNKSLSHFVNYELKYDLYGGLKKILKISNEYK